jgi:hypothetical protein
VLFDSEIRFNADGDILRDVENGRAPPDSPDTYPGTPRHPAYGSGHSTYSKAASEVLKAFLPECWGMPNIPGGMIEDVHSSLDRLAESIGEARFWGGVHWRKDHEFGKAVGQAVADLIIEQLNDSLVDPKPSAFKSVPDVGALEDKFKQVAKMPTPRWKWKKDGPYPKCEEGKIAVAQEGGLQGGRV